MRRSFPTNDVFLKDLFEGFESRSGQTQFFFRTMKTFKKRVFFECLESKFDIEELYN